MKSFTNSRKFLFGVSVSMVLAMAIGSFALGENQTLASPSAVETQSEEATNGTGLFNVTGGTEGVNYSYANSVLTIHSGNLTISTNGETTERIVVDGAATITLSGVNINTNTGAALQIQDDATFNVNILLKDGSDNILKTTAENHAGLQKNGSGDSIGTLTIGVPDGSQGTGKLQANGGNQGAGIGGGNWGSGSNITITGGEVTANGGTSGAGIGGGYYGAGTDITINGSEVTANGGDQSAGIGGGYQGNGGEITITGGSHVTANGGSGDKSGAGIGGGYYGDGMNITIDGSEVTATGGRNGAGIGGGYNRHGKNIIITGSEVTAKGIYQGAGIGGGNNGNGSDIDITDSEVKEASGGKYASGIGGGYYGDGMNITITNSEVNAIGGYGSAGIGGGWYKTGSNIDIIDSKIMATGGGGSSGAGIGGGGNDTSSSGNKIRGNAVVMVASGGNTKDALEGFDSGNITGGIVFTGIGTTFDSDSRATDFSWDESGTMYSDSVTISQNVEFPANLTIEDGKEITLEAGKTLTILAGATLTNEGIFNIGEGGNITCQYDEAAGTTGEVTTKTDFYLEGSTDVYATGYQTYQTNAGVQKYTNLPNPGQTNANGFVNWYYVDQDGRKTKIDENSFVALNAHSFYENLYSISVAKQGEGEITPNVTEAAKDDTVTFEATPADGYELKEESVTVTDADGNEVSVTEQDGKYTFTMPGADVTVSAAFELIPEPSVDPGVKTGDSFAGFAALAILGLATTGAVMLRKRK